MKSRLVLVAACAAVFARSNLAQTPRNQPVSPLIGVYLDFDHAPGAVSIEAMKRVVENLFKPAGLTLAWRLSGENTGTETFSGLAVLKFRGYCETTAPKPASEVGTIGELNALAYTAVSGGRVLPYTQVECDQVRKALAYVPAWAGMLERQQALGLALGRVVAHELYHILGDTAAHASQGLARASEALRDLVSPRDLRFDESASRAIRKRFQSAK